MQNDTQLTPRVPRTHANAAVIQVLKNLPLISILQKNKEIENQNAERALKTLNHTVNNEAYPEPGSDAASLITLDPEDRDRFKIPSFALSFRDYIYSSLAKWIADEDTKEKEDQKLKRKTTDEPKMTAEEARIAKRRCMNGKKLIPWVVGVPWQAKFPQSLFDTEGCVAIPLPFFLNENLQILNAEAATLPTIKTNPNPGETKGISIIDVDKLSAHFGKELSLTCSQWTEAAGNMYLFQKERDAADTEESHSDWYNDHFNFYLSQRFKVKLYDAWKGDELKFRQEHWASYGAFEGYRYEQAFALSEKQYEMMAKIREMMATTNKSTFSRSGRSSSSSTDCLICGDRGHNSRIHNDSVILVKFKDGKPTWAKSINRALVTPDNRVLCINWNVRGSNAVCTHSKDERVHLCSFCGQKGHHAFSWTCRPPPN
ncbi:hypothetical protein BYT27DRAFT_7080989 [Phlegmacium glaucopus]|nr:hypothetical protein BYT27DRAFT_7080989 [Phlegmacium glaucopus]